MNRYLLLIFTTLFLAQCSSGKQEEIVFGKIPAEFSLNYTADQRSVKFEDLEIDFKLDANPNSKEILLSLVLQNISQDTVLFDFNDIELITPQKIRKQFGIDRQAIAIKADTAIAVALPVLPVNNLLLYKKTEYNGDLHNEYELRIKNQAFAFRISPEQRTLLDSIAIDDEFTLYKLQNTATGLRATDQEILKDGVVLKLKFFELKDTLNAKLSIVNHGTEQLLLLPDQLFVSLNKNLYTPLKLAHKGGLTHQDTLFLPQGKRFWEEIQFALPEKPDSFVFMMNGVLSNQRKPFVVAQKLIKE